MSEDNLLTADQPHSVSVGELTGHIKAILEGSFPSVWISGEVSDLVRPRSGHLYFTLKDEDAQIRGIIWRSTAQRMKEQIKDGQSVLCFGDVEVYAARGSYQLVVRKVQTQGLGRLQQKFEAVRAKLHNEGLFDADRKLAIPTHPRRIAVITSPSGAAVRDFLKAAALRMRGVDVLVIPALVQGVGSVDSVASAVELAQQIRPKFDTIILTRGGGSLEDLWTFNEEAVVRAVASCQIPTVSAIGHEIDVTLCDLAADQRALTPTDAASRVMPDQKRVEQRLSELQGRLQRVSRDMIDSRLQRLANIESRAVIRKPHEIIQSRSRRLDEWDARAQRSMMTSLERGKNRLGTAAAALSALSPLDVLTRGYSVTMGPDGTAVQNAHQVSTGDTLTTRLHSGVIVSEVTSTEADR